MRPVIPPRVPALPRRAAFLLAAFLLAAFLLALPARAQDLYFVDAAAACPGDGLAWATAFCDLQSALAVAEPGDEIRVAEGTYKPTTGNDRTATFQLESGVAIYGGYPAGGGPRDPAAHPTILSGDLNGDDNGNVSPYEPTRNDNSCNVVTGSGADATAVLDGFTITGGNANLSNGPSQSNTAGGGIKIGGRDHLKVHLPGSPVLRNLLLTGNTAANIGGGLEVATAGSNPTLIDVTFVGNTALSGGGMCVHDSAGGTLTNVTFSGNDTFLGGGGGLSLNNTASVILANAVFTGNTGLVGGGGLATVSSSPVLTNVTFYGNSAGSGGGIYAAYGGSVEIHNSIVWGNTASNGANVWIEGSAAITFAHSLIEGSGGSTAWNAAFGSDGGSNLDADPRFADAAAGDFTLLSGSPALDAGDDALLPADVYDLDGDADTAEPLPFDLAGNPRLIDNGSGTPTVDLGAYEAPPGVLLPVELSSFTAVADGAAVVLRWETASETNNAGFEIQWVSNPEIRNPKSETLNWKTLAFVAGVGTTVEAQAYSYRADALEPGTYRFRLRQVDYDGAFTFSPEVEVTVEAPRVLALSANHPNPFGAGPTRFTFTVAADGPAVVEVYDVLGRRVAVPFDGPAVAGRVYDVAFDAGALASGVYLYAVRSGGRQVVRRMTLVK